MKGYIIFCGKWTWDKNFVEFGKTYRIEEDHYFDQSRYIFCTEIIDLYLLSARDPDEKVAEIEALGEIGDVYYDVHGGTVNAKYTDKFKLIREVDGYEVVSKINYGIANTGQLNKGNYNTGNCNKGNYNVGDGNGGNYNTGHGNKGNYNVGDQNIGNENVGSFNIGSCNIGNVNSGDRNTGNGNVGEGNTGDYNLCSFSTGCFNTVEQPMMFFDQPSDMTPTQWRNSIACSRLESLFIRPIEFIDWMDMTEEEKDAHPNYFSDGGYYKMDVNDWLYLEDPDIEAIKTIPNFDAEKFYKITGIQID